MVVVVKVVVVGLLLLQDASRSKRANDLAKFSQKERERDLVSFTFLPSGRLPLAISTLHSFVDL